MRRLAVGCAFPLMCATALAQTPIASPTAPDEQLWRQIAPLIVPTPPVEPYETRFEMEIDRLERLISRLQSYQGQFPGGARTDDAIALELAAHLHLATLTNSSERLAERCRALAARPLSDALRSRIARYLELGERLIEGPDFLNRLRRATDDADTANAAATRPGKPARSEPIENPPTSRAKRSESPAPDGREPSPRAATLRRAAAIDTPLAFDVGSDLTTSLRAAGLCERSVLIVIWASWDERSVEAAAMAGLARSWRPDLGILGLSIDLDRARMRDAIDAYALDGVQLRAEQGWASPLLTTWNLRRLPALLLIDSGGVLRAIEEDGDVFDVIGRLETLEE